jgi:APA family basic amino acid/polyamine antiporter
VGIILGAGIYALVGEAAERAGNAFWISFLIAALMAALTGLSYAELASVYPKAGADYEYTRRALGRRPATIVGTVIIAGNLIAAGAVSLGFGAYFSTLADSGSTIPALLALAVAGAIAIYGIRESLWTSIILTFVEFSGLVLVIAIGVPHFGDVDLLDTNAGVTGILSASALIMFAFIGFEQIATLAEETQHANKVVPRALLLSIGVTTALYVLVAVAAVSVLGAQTLGAADAPLAEVASDVLGNRASDVLALIALFATFNTILLLLVAASRLVYGMAGSGSLPQALSFVQPKFRTPVRAILACWLVASGFALIGDIALVAEAANFAILIGFMAVSISLIVLRFGQPELPRPFRVPLHIGRLPLTPLAALASIWFMIANLQVEAILIGLGLVVIGVGAAAVFGGPGEPNAESPAGKAPDGTSLGT